MSTQTEPVDGSVGRRVAKATGAIVLAHMAMKLLGAIEKPLMASSFGTGVAADAFTAASGLVVRIFLFMEQLLTHCFMPTFIQTRAGEGERQAWRLGSTVANLILIAFGTLGLLLAVFAPQVVRLTTRFSDPAVTDLTAFLLRIMVPAAVILPVSSLTYVILNAYKVFGLPAAADAAFKAGTVVALVLLLSVASGVGVPLLAAGVVVGAVAKLGMHLIGLRKRLSLYRPVLDLRHPPVRVVGILALPLMVGNILSIARPTLDIWFASGLGVGAVAALTYARALVDTPAQVFPYALRIALFPFMSEMAASGDRERMTDMLVRSLRVVAIVFAPLTAAMIILRHPIVETIYQWGKFTEGSTDLVVPAMAYLSLGLLAMGAEMILLEPYFSLSDTATPTKIGVFTFFVHVVLAWAGIRFLNMGVGGITLAYTASRTLKVVILAWGLRGRLTPVPVRPLLQFTARIAAAVAGMSVIIALLLAHPLLQGPPGKLGDVIRLMVPGAAGVAAFVVLSLALRLDEASYLLGAVVRRVRRKR